jgi:diadenosine tetraphosphatase ApaH/serine/threonine PP2A family protein phosphatase
MVIQEIAQTLRAIVLPCAAFLASTAPAQVERVSNGFLQLGVDRARGNIVELVDVATRQNFAHATGDAAGLWELEFAGASSATLTPASAGACDVETFDRGTGLRLVWRQFGLADAPALRVEVTARLEASRPFSRWQIAVDSPGLRTLARIRFPRVLDLARLERERLVVPSWAGLLAPNPRQALTGKSGVGRRREYDYPGRGSMQCLAYYADGGPGLYLACDDSAGQRKSFAAFGDGDDRLNLEIIHLPAGDATNGRHTLPYSVVLGTFRGDWYEAAAIYRAWATGQPWARESRRQRDSVPSWIADTGLWVWNRGRSPGVLEPAVVLQREAGLPVSVFWHWWHGCAYDTGFPEYLPPREGETAFIAALARAHERGVHALVYMNQRLWGMTTASWTDENAARFAVKTADGTVRPEIYNTFTKQPCASMCLGTEFWRAKYAGIAAEAFNHLGVDGIYMDQACSSLACYDPTHGHPAGGGTYWTRGFQTLAADLRRRGTARGGVALAGEGCAENWLPHLDLMLALEVSRERYAAPDGWEAIPFFHAVYHDYGLFYGNYSSLTMPPYDDLWPAESAPPEPLRLLDRKFSQQFFLEQARAFVWGQQPTIANFLASHLHDRPEEIAYVVRLAQARRRARPFLQEGAMLAPPTIEAPDEDIPMSRLSIYAGQQGGVKEFNKTVPLVLASTWRAPNGRVAVAVASIADRSLTPTLTINAARNGLPPHGRWRVLGEADAQPVGMFAGKAWILKPQLAPRDVRVFVLETN